MKAILNTAYCSYICTVQPLQLIEKLRKNNSEFCPALVYLFIPAERVTAGEKQRMHLMQASSGGWREEQRWALRTAEGLGKVTEQNQEEDMPLPGFPLLNKIVQ